MKNKHVSDYDIQQFTFDLSECKTEVIKHISSCKTCKMRSESYLSLSNAIENLSDPIIDYNLSDEVLKQLETASKKRSIYNYFIYFLITLSILVVISCLFYFKGVFIDVFRSNSAISISLIISITLLIASVMILDILRSYNKKINMLN